MTSHSPLPDDLEKASKEAGKAEMDARIEKVRRDRREFDFKEAEPIKKKLQKKIQEYLKTNPGLFDDQNLTLAKHKLINKLSQELNDCHYFNEIYTILKRYRNYCTILLRQSDINRNRPGPSKQEAETLVALVGKKIFDAIGTGNAFGAHLGKAESMLDEAISEISDMAKSDDYKAQITVGNKTVKVNKILITSDQKDRKSYLEPGGDEIELAVPNDQKTAGKKI